MAGEPQHPPGDQAGELAHAVHRSNEQHRHVLQEILEQLQVAATTIGLGGDGIDRMVENWPMAGLKRFSISNRRAQGNSALAIPAGESPATAVMPANPARLGGSIVNSGANAVVLFLTEPGRAVAGAGAIWLAPNGGTWDLTLSDRIWCGAVSAVSTAGTTLAWAQV